MNSKIITFASAAALVAAVAVTGAGCVNTVDGRSQAGVPFVKDNVQGSYIGSFNTVMAAVRRVLKTNGQIKSDDVQNNVLEATVDNNTVWVKVEEIDNVKHVVQVTVEARRRAGGTNLDLAHDIDKQIAVMLTTAQ